MLAGNLFITPQLGAVKDIGLESLDPAVVAAKVCEADEKSKECVVALIKKYADAYDFSEKMALDVASCESEFKTTALGDKGKAYGIYQFHRPTFEMFSKKLGEKLNYHDTEDNIKLAIWALSQDKGHHWTCYRKIAAK